jgi:ABC-type lipoprotein release transport system permease subunit
MAWRNVWRNSRRSLTAIAATSLGLVAMILYAGLMDGLMTGLERDIVDVEMGDVQVHAPEYRTSRSLHDRIEQPAEVLEALDAHGLAAAPRLLASGLAAAGDSSAGVSLRGIDVERDARISKVSQRVTRGAWLDPAHPDEVVIGRRLSQMLGVEVGQEVLVLSQAADGSTANDLYNVRGILEGVSDEVDRGGIFMVASAFRQLMTVPEGAHQIIVRSPDRPLDETARVVDSIAADLDARTWRELQPTLASMLDSSRGAMVAMFLIVYLAIGIVILNAMLMAVFERVRELGVLKALGVGPGGVLGLIVLESAIQTTLAVIIGVAISIPANWYLSTHGIDLRSLGNMSMMGMAIDPVWRARVSVDSYVQPVTILLVIVGLAVIYPALRAAFIRPVEAMRSQ